MGMPEVSSLAVEILEGLVQLHAVGIWHLDLIRLADTAELHSLEWLGRHATLPVRPLKTLCTKHYGDRVMIHVG